MIVQERGPRLGGLAATAPRPRWHVASHGARRECQTEFHAELRRDALFAPDAVVRCHFCDESLDISGNAGSSPTTGLQPPEETKEIAVPPHERPGPNNRQELTPVDELRQEDESDSRGVVRVARSDLAFDVTGHLLAEEQILGRQLPSGPEHEPKQAQQVSEEDERR